VLGYINPESISGGTVKISYEAARQSVERLAKKLDKSVDETAFGIHLMANSKMTSAIKAVSTRRGQDIRKVDMLAFGGGGPLQAVGLAAMLKMRRVIVPSNPGVFSSIGLLLADIEHHVARGYVAALSSLNFPHLNDTLRAMEHDVKSQLEPSSDDSRMVLARLAVLKLRDRSGDVVAALPDGDLVANALSDVYSRFRTSYERIYRHMPPDPDPIIVRLMVIGKLRSGLEPAGLFQSLIPTAGPGAGLGRLAYFGPAHGRLETPVVSRTTLTEDWTPGPVIVEDADSSSVVHPGWQVRCDQHFNLIVESRHVA
jgi:N-methylhydantoinase A